MSVMQPFRAGSFLAVAIVGGSGSGKSWLADKLAATLRPRAVRLSLDDFYRDRSHLSTRRRNKVNFDNPRAIDWAGFEETLRGLLEGKPVRVPHYNFATHSRWPNTRLLKPGKVIVTDGLWLLSRRSLKGLFALRVYVDCSSRTRLRRRLARDRANRGRTEASIREQFLATVEPMHRKYVVPQKERANFVLKEKFGLRELSLLKSAIKALRAPRPAQRRGPRWTKKSFRRGH